METQTLPAMEIPEPVKEPTEHPHVVWIPNTFGKKLVIDEAYISIWVLASMFRDGSTPQDLIETYPHAKPAAIYDAISYYLDHSAEVDAEIESNKIENVLAKHNARIDAGGFIVFNDQTPMSDLPRLFIALYTDHDVTNELAIELRKRNFTAYSAQEVGLGAAKDLEQLEYAARNGLTLLTFNTSHFLELHNHYLSEEKTHSGIVVSKQQFNKAQLGELLRLPLALLNTYDAEQMINRLVYLTQFK